MATTTVNIRMDEQTKRTMGELCDELGISMSTAFNMFAKTMVRERRLPTEVTTLDPFYSTENMNRVRHAAAALDAGHGGIHDLIED